MCDKHKVFFRIKLQEWKKELVRANNEALYNGSMDDNSISADIVDQASLLDQLYLQKYYYRPYCRYKVLHYLL